MSTTYAAAIDEMYSVVKTAAVAAASSVGIAGLDVRYLGRDKEVPPVVTNYLMEVSQVGTNNRQAAFGVSSRLFTQTGGLRLRVYAPQASQNSFRKGQLFADAMKNAFRVRKVVADVWYRNARVVEMMPERGAYRFDVAVDYSYDERQ